MKIRKFIANIAAFMLVSSSHQAIADELIKEKDVDQVIHDYIARDGQKLFSIYKDIHAHPELAFQEFRTSAILAKNLKSAGFQVTTNVGGTGVVAVLANGPGPTFLIRADMDALPVEEKTGFAWASKARANYEGKDVPVMHACGHDAHVAYLIGVADVLSQMRGNWSGTAVLIGQPAEERLAGARAMLDAGLLTRFPRPEFGLAAHINNFPLGSLAIKEGAAASASDSYSILFHGRGGHGSMPAETIDPVLMAARFVDDVQSIISREKDPAKFGVITVGSFQAGVAPNVIPDDATVLVNIRSQSSDVRDKLKSGVKRVALAEAALAAAPAPTFTELPSTGVLFNDPTLARRVAARLTTDFGAGVKLLGEQVTPMSGSEDYSEFVNAGIPSVYIGVGAYAPAEIDRLKQAGLSVPTNHSPLFSPEAMPAISNAVTALVEAVLVLAPSKPALN